MEQLLQLYSVDDQTFQELDALELTDRGMQEKLGKFGEIRDQLIAMILPMIEILKEDIGGKILTSDDPIYLAVMKGDFTRTVELLSRKVASGFSVDHDFPREDNTTPSLLTTAVLFCHANIVKKLIEMGSAPIYRNWDPYFGQFDISPLFLACILSCSDMISTLYEAGNASKK